MGVPVGIRARESLGGALPRNLPGRLVPPENWHFTLCFLGNTPALTRQRVIAELSRESFGEPFVVRLSGLGAFPRPKHARVLWVGVGAGGSRLTEIAALAATACRRAGVELGDRPYSPHLTVSRIAPPRDVRSVISSSAAIEVDTDVNEILLLRSRFGDGPPRYDAVASFPLAGIKLQ